MSILLDAEIVTLVVLAAVLEADLGSHRKISRFRLLRPVLLAIIIVPIFLDKIATHGGGLVLELAGATVGLAGGLIALALMKVYRSDTTGEPVTSAKWGYAVFWTAVIGARALFSYGAEHWFTHQLGNGLTSHSVPSTALTNALIFMAVVMVIVRTGGLRIRARGVRSTGKRAVTSPDPTRV